MPRPKPTPMPIWLSRTLLTGIGLILLLMPVHAFISTWGGTAIGPLWLWKSWKELLLVGLVLLTLGWLAIARENLKQLAKKPLVVAILGYVLLTVLLAAIYFKQNGQDASMAALAMNLRYLGVGALAYLLFRFGQVSGAWSQRAQWFVISAGVFVAVVGILQVLIFNADTLTRFGYDKELTIAPAVLIDDDPNLLRAFATLRGPNDFGAFLILPILLVVARLKRLPIWVTTTMLSLMGVALLLSSSRSAWVGLVIALTVYGFYVFGGKIPKLVILGMFVGAVLAGVALFYTAISVPIVRQAVFHSSPGDASLTEGSTDQHTQATLGGVRRTLAQPLGCGPGCTGPASYYGGSAQVSENYFVQIAEEVGVLGLILFLMICGLVLVELHRNSTQSRFSKILVSALVGYGAIGLWLHVWSDDPLSITWWILAGAVIGYNESKPWKKSKNSLRSRTSSSS